MAYKIRRTIEHDNERWAVEVSTPINAPDLTTTVKIRSHKDMTNLILGRPAATVLMTSVDSLDELVDLRDLLSSVISEARGN